MILLQDTRHASLNSENFNNNCFNLVLKYCMFIFKKRFNIIKTIIHFDQPDQTKIGGYVPVVRIYVLNVHTKNYSHIVFIYPLTLWIYMCSFEWIFVYCRCGLNYTSIFRKTNQAMALIVAVYLFDIYTYILAKYRRFLFSPSKPRFLKKTPRL